MHAKIFDIDGTLLQSATIDDELYREAVVTVLGDVRFRPSLQDYDFVTDSGILRQLLRDNEIKESESRAAEIKSCFLELVRGHISKHGPFPEVPGAKIYFDQLRMTEDCGVSIATGGWRETALEKLLSAGFDISDVPLASSDDAWDRQEIMRLSLAQLGHEFDTITYFGDGVWDQAASKSLGWQFVAVGPDLGGIQSYLESHIAIHTAARREDE